MKTILPVVVGVGLALAGAGAAARAQDSAQKKVELAIQSETLADALAQWADQTDLQLITMARQTDSLSAPAIKGRFTPQAALDQLLAGTPLVSTWLNERTVAIQQKVQPLPAVPGNASQPHAQSIVLAAQATASPEIPPVSSGASSAQAPSPIEPEGLEEIVVTGTHIRGASSAGTHVQVIDRRAIEASGYSTIQDVLTNTVPQNYGGAPSEDFSGNSANYNLGTGVNLRGLGADATLVLIDGHRVASSGSDASFVDISGIPASAVKRIELLTDGASAVYGSDAVGGVVNIILRDDFEGAESSAHMGMAKGGLEELTIAQLLGSTWSGGHLLGGYQFYDRASLARADRTYTATADQRRFGGDDWRFGFANPGNILDPVTFSESYAIPLNQDGTGLTTADLVPGTVNRATLQEGADLLPDVRMHSAFLTASQALNDSITLKAEGRYSRRETHRTQFGFPVVLVVPNTNPFFVDPFGGSDAVFVEYSMGADLGLSSASGVTDTFSAAVGTDWSLQGDWLARTYVSYAEENTNWTGRNNVNFTELDAALADPDPSTAFNGFGAGSHTNPATLERIRDTVRQHSLSDVAAINLVFDGPVWSMPGGPARLAFGFDYREEDLRTRSSDYAGPVRTVLGRNTSAAYAELSVPLLHPSADTGRSPLQLSLAGRYEEYSDFGSTVNPKMGVEWTPSQFLKFRATWGTSFKAPRLVDLNETTTSNSAQLTSFIDPTSPTGESPVLVRNGKNAHLNEETATIWTVGADFAPFGEGQPTASLTYFDISYKDRILIGGPPSNSSGILQQEEAWSAIITRDPTDEQLLAICDSPEFDGDPADCLAVRPTIIDFRLRNLGTVDVQGIDLGLAHHTSATWGDLAAQVNATRMFHYRRAASEQSSKFEAVDTVGNPLAFRLRAGLSWELQGWSADIFANYAGAYADDISNPHRRVDSWTTVDLRLGYSTEHWSRLTGLEVSLTATNVLDERPPFYNFESGYDEVNADLMGRMVGIQVTKIW